MKLAVDLNLAQNAAMITIDQRGYFITGSDTDVGKTYISCQLIRQLIALQQCVEVRKPAESGCQFNASGELVGPDSSLLSKATGQMQSADSIAPFRFQAALAPHRAARLEGSQLHLRELITACDQQLDDHLLLVEGAGGFYSPLAEDALNADLASALQLPIIIVINDRIGAVNQALLTIAAVESRQLQIAAVILNQLERDHAANMDNHSDLMQHCDYPIFQCGFEQSLPSMFSHDGRI